MSQVWHQIHMFLLNMVFYWFRKLWRISKRGRLVDHWIYLLDLISKNNLKFGLRQVSARKQFNLYFHRMFSSFPCGYDWEVSQFKDALRGKRWLWKKQNSVLSLPKKHIFSVILLTLICHFGIKWEGVKLCELWVTLCCLQKNSFWNNL